MGRWQDVRKHLRKEFPNVEEIPFERAVHIATVEADLEGVRALHVTRRILAGWQDGPARAPIFARSDRRAVQAGQRQAEPEVVALREELFVTDDPPFVDEEAARGWLAGAWEHAARQEADREALDRALDALQGEPYSPRPFLQRVWTWEAFEDEKLERRTGRPGWYVPTIVRPGNPYYTLGQSVQVVTEAVGGYALDWTLHVLTGREVTIPAFQVRVLRGGRDAPPDAPTRISGEWEIPAHVQIRMNRPLTHRELREMYGGVSEVWGGEGLTCETCGDGFEAARKDAKYCSNACKQKAYRERKAG